MTQFRSNPKGRQVCHRIDLPDVLRKRRDRRSSQVPGGATGPRGVVMGWDPASPDADAPLRAADHRSAKSSKVAEQDWQRAAEIQLVEKAAAQRAQIALDAALAAQSKEAMGDPAVQDAIATLERRLQKLAGALENQESLLLEIRHKESADEGIASNFRTVQGLKEGHPEGKRKRELMQQIFESNQELRERITSLRRLAE